MDENTENHRAEPVRSNLERPQLERRWLRLTRETLPALAARRDEASEWPVRFDHCFQRILLDNACGTVWYDRIDGRPAYTHAPDDILEAAVALGESVKRGESDLHALNRRSLAWRGKARGKERAERG